MVLFGDLTAWASVEWSTPPRSDEGDTEHAGCDQNVIFSGHFKHGNQLLLVFRARMWETGILCPSTCQYHKLCPLRVQVTATLVSNALPWAQTVVLCYYPACYWSATLFGLTKSAHFPALYMYMLVAQLFLVEGATDAKSNAVCPQKCQIMLGSAFFISKVSDNRSRAGTWRHLTWDLSSWKPLQQPLP